MRDDEQGSAAALDAGAEPLSKITGTGPGPYHHVPVLALGLGEGGEQNAPLGRAVIGGLVFATVSTLLFVPAVYAGVHVWLLKRKSQWQKTPEPSAAPGS